MTMITKGYGKTITESILAFLISTFMMALFLTHLQSGWMATGITMSVLYLIVISICTARVIKPLPVAVVMILIPIIPLAALLFIISFIHLLQLFT